MRLLETALDRAAKAAAVLVDDPGKTREVLQRRGRRQIQRLSGRNEQRLDVEGVRLDLGRRIDSIWKAERRDVDLTAAKLRQKLLGPACGDAQREIRKAATEPVSECRYPDLRQVRRDAEPELAADDPPGRQARLEISQHAEHPSPVRIGFAARRGWLQGLRLPVEQGDAKLFFQALDAAAYAGLREMKPRRSANDRAGLHHRQKGLEVSRVHAILA